MMRVIGDPCEGKLGGGFLVTEILAYNLYTGFKTMMLLGKVIKKSLSVCLLNVLGHRVSPGMLAPVETVRSIAERGSSSVAQLHGLLPRV
jgi:hypothetical protein